MSCFEERKNRPEETQKYPKQLLKYAFLEEYFENFMESLLLGGRNYCWLTIVKPSFMKFRDGSETEFTTRMDTS